ncbi:MAG TPA: GTP-binding protein, partial [Acidobacteriota bacterium]|nr:GTP-binding protein [Acidobacteriota bacterium]
MISDISRIRNIGISAHIDSGKTTLTERILFYTRRIHAMHDVKGKDGVGATMDHMELERERGITITSAATYVTWKDHYINIIDTPGHVDFTIEVERALRVLDGAVLVLCAVAGVQSQSITVDRQMRRYGVPRLAFVNKCDRTGAHPDKVVRDLREKLGLRAVLMQLPIGLEAKFEGLVDLVEMKAVYFRGPDGNDLEYAEIPADMKALADERRADMLDTLTLFSDELTEAVLEGTETVEQIHAAIRKGVLALQLVPVFIGSAYKNKGVQPLLDAVTRYLPSPLDRTAEAIATGDEEKSVRLTSDPDKPTVALAFKLDEGRYGQLTFIRVYEGKLVKGGTVVNQRNGRKVKLGRIVRMHADEMQDIEDAGAGDICGLFGI